MDSLRLAVLDQLIIPPAKGVHECYRQLILCSINVLHWQQTEQVCSPKRVDLHLVDCRLDSTHLQELLDALDAAVADTNAPDKALHTQMTCLLHDAALGGAVA